MYLLGILCKLCILMYYLEILAIRRDFNFDQIYALFGVNLFCLKSWLCKFWTFRRSAWEVHGKTIGGSMVVYWRFLGGSLAVYKRF